MNNQRATALLLAGSALVSWSPDAHAQRIPWFVLPLAALPVVALRLSLVLGTIGRRWRAAAANAALVTLWIAWFALASNHATSDWRIWASIGAVGLHAVGMGWFIALGAFRRMKGRSR